MSDTVLVALIGGCTTVIVAVVGIIGALLLRRVAQLEVKVDGRLTQLLASTAGQSHAEGVTAGEAAERDRGTAS